MTIDFTSWCDIDKDEVNGHDLRLLIAKDPELKSIVWALAGTLPAHYAAPQRIAAILKKFGKEKAAAFIASKIPTSKTGKSSDLGEIFSTEYIDAHTRFGAPIKRLRWRDHREVAMRGDDVIGIDASEKGPVWLLKAEAKSRASLKTQTVEEARAALNRDDGLPSPHALGFVAERLHEIGNETLGDLIDDIQLNKQIKRTHVEHLLFTFSGNAPRDFLAADLESYRGKIRQNSVGLRVKGHQDFIAEVYDNIEVDDDA
jgi:hypothetical protein